MTEGRSSLVHVGFDIDHRLCALVRFDINGSATVNYVLKTIQRW